MKSQRKRANIPLRPNGLYLLKGTRTLSSLASFDATGDELELFEFPSKYNTYLVGFTISPGDLDTHATPTVTLDVLYENSAGTETVLVSESTAGQTGAKIEYLPSISAGTGFLLDVTGGSLRLEIGNAAQATAATTASVSFSILVYVGDAVELGTSAD